MTNSVNEILDEDVFLIIGSNTTEAHPIIGNKMKQAIIRGAKAIVVDPRKTELAGMAHYYLPIKSGTDAALINGIMNVIIENGWEDEDYIKQRVEGFDAVKETVKAYDLKTTSEITGISEEMIYNVAKLYAETEKAGIFYTLGITEHTTGTSNVMNLANLALITGHVGIESAGVNPLRGQNNVQGACDMGALPNSYPGYPSVIDDKARENFEELWETSLNPKLGLRIPEMFDKALEGELKAMIVMGEDPVLSDPNANHVRRAFEALDFRVSLEIFMSETAKYADVIFPAACYAEKEGTFTASERRVQRVRKAVDAPGLCKPDWEIVKLIANKMGVTKGFEWRSAEDIFDDIRAAMPSYRGMTYERLGNEGLQWPCPTLDHPGTKYLHKGVFPRGKARMVPVEYEKPAELCDEEYPILLNTGRKLGHYNITTRFSPKLEEINPYELAEVNPEDAKKLGLKELDYARVSSRRGSIITRVTITDRVQPGNMFMTFHFKESPVNELTNDEFDPITLTAEYKISAVKLEKVKDADDDIKRFVPLTEVVEA